MLDFSAHGIKSGIYTISIDGKLYMWAKVLIYGIAQNSIETTY